MSDLLKNYQRLKEIGITPYWCIDHRPTTSIDYRDPDRNQVELQIDNFAAAGEGRAYMESPAFRKNPVGVEFDPDTLIARLRAGAGVEEPTMSE